MYSLNILSSLICFMFLNNLYSHSINARCVSRQAFYSSIFIQIIEFHGFFLPFWVWNFYYQVNRRFVTGGFFCVCENIPKGRPHIAYYMGKNNIQARSFNSVWVIKFLVLYPMKGKADCLTILLCIYTRRGWKLWRMILCQNDVTPLNLCSYRSLFSFGIETAGLSLFYGFLRILSMFS